MNFSCSSAFVTLAARDLEKLVLFYSNLLDITPQQYTPNRYAEFELPGLRLGIFQPKQTRQPEFQNSSSAMSLCLEVSDLENAIAHLTHLGYPPPGETLTASHGKEIYVYDPEGNRLILHQFS
ncbi:VOC family protein [Chroococcidiopsis sp. TS-821]|uniref:VOC family protein n=1 Tax=Chroococcidiopsis sp. TS-821 TaxID=1378066 RepID=UPI000CEE9746|nr:VOC family protein [Chroococcidiopsis sp. TS-821]PPS46043.1 glyoxalase [Chroococcidiopsis sp. TS-821]